MLKASARQFRIVPAIAALFVATTAIAASPTTGSFDVQLTIEADCSMATGAVLNFGTTGTLVANVDQSTTIAITCTKTTNYTIALNAGANAGTPGDVSTRLMVNGSEDISYNLYTNAGRTTVWGNTVGTDTVAATGDGDAQIYTVYGRVGPQTTPPPGLYEDTITVTMAF
jgi:spore coat protein U-like protein